MPPARTSTQDVRDSAKEEYGFLPNLLKEISEHNPAAAQSYLATMNLLKQGTLSAPERQTVLLAVSRYNDCHYCTSAHAQMGEAAGLDADTVDAINTGSLPEDERLRALVQATRLLLDKRGWLDDEDRESLREQGIDESTLHEINALIGVKTFSNFVNHVADTPVDPQMS